MQMDIKEVKLEIYVPEEYVAKIRDDLAERGIGKVGNYSHVVAYQESKGRFTVRYTIIRRFIGAGPSFEFFLNM